MSNGRIRRRLSASLAVIAIMAVGGATLASAAPAANDDIADAIELTLGIEQRFNVTDATAETDEEFCEAEETVWFEFTAPEAGDYVGYITGSNYDSYGGWFTDLTDASPECSDDTDESYDGAATVTFAEDETRYYQVSHYEDESTVSIGQGGIGVLKVGAATDDFADAAALDFAAGSDVAAAAIADVDSTTTETGENTDCGVEANVSGSAWFTFRPPTTRSWLIERRSDAGGELAVYTGDSVDDLTLLNCTSLSNESRPAVALQLTAGETYMIQVTAEGDDTVLVRAEPSAIRSVMTVIDDGSAAVSEDIGARAASIVQQDGHPAVAYTDADNETLFFASRNEAGTWVTSPVPTTGDPDDDLDLIQLEDGSFVIAYYDTTGNELRIVTGSPGSWSDSLVDDDGDGTSTDVGETPTALQLDDGRLAIVYAESINDEVRIAIREANSSWTEARVDDGDPSLRHGAFAQGDDGTLWVAYTNDSDYETRIAESSDGATWVNSTIWTEDYEEPYDPVVGIAPNGTVWVAFEQHIKGLLIAEQSGSGWTIHTDDADHDLAELADDGIADILFDDAGYPMIVWVDENASGGVAVSRKTSTGWRVEDLVGLPLAVDDPEFEGSLEFDDLSAVLLPGDELLVFGQFEGADGDPSLVVLEDALRAAAADPAASPGAASVSLDGTDSSDAWGDISSYHWTDAPDLCTISDSWSATASVWCIEPTTGSVRLTVTDQDGNTSFDEVDLAFTGPECDDTADPFTDVPASSYADDSVTCIYNLDVTTGIGGNLYAPDGFVTRAQMATFMARLYEAMTNTVCPLAVVPFTDMPGNYADDPIRCIFGLDVTTGTSDTTYSPDDIVTREQMAAFLGRLWLAIHGANAPAVAVPFTDMPGNYADVWIKRIFGLEITTGTGPTTYGPDDFVTREQMAAFLARFYVAVLD